jgi:hypothetical protein
MGPGENRFQAALKLQESAYSGIGAIEAELTALVERMEAEITDRLMLTEESARQLRQLRIRAEQFLGTTQDQNAIL